MIINNEPLVYIIILNYNGLQLTLECIESLKKISYRNFKIVVVDNNSNDKSVEMLIKYEDSIVKLIKSTKNLGFTGGNNLGIDYALKENADFVLLLNNDTLVEQNFLGPLVDVFKKIPNCGMSIGKIFYESERNKIWYGGGSLNYKTARTEHFIDNCLEYKENGSPVEVSFATGCCLCIPRQVLKTVGKLDDDYFIYSDDVDYSYRVSKENYKIIYVPESVIYHKVSSTFGELSMTTQRLTVRNIYLFIKKSFRGINKCTAYFYISILLVYKIIIGNLKIKNFLIGVLDFLKGKTGKPDWLS